jgi:hypothetical protein
VRNHVSVFKTFSFQNHIHNSRNRCRTLNCLIQTSDIIHLFKQLFE